MPAAKDISGCRFGRLVAIERTTEKSRGSYKWLCKCDCGNYARIQIAKLINGHTKSCGCLVKEGTHITHGKTGTRLYRIWQAMKNRCNNPNVPNYRIYGAEGKTVCDEWLHNFQAFYDWSMSHGYRDDLTIDRIDGTKGYSPDNCRWATRKEQANNIRINRFIEYNGKKQTMSQWAEELNINYRTLRSRILSLGWDIQKSLTKRGGTNE